MCVGRKVEPWTDDRLRRGRRGRRLGVQRARHLSLPRIPVDEGSLATGGLIALPAVVLGTLIAALIGGKAGERYHRRVDRVGHVR